MASALVDAGSMVAVFGVNQPHAQRYLDLLKRAEDERWSLFTTCPCVVEASYLLAVPQRYTLLRWVGAGGIAVCPFHQPALTELVARMQRYTEAAKRMGLLK